MTSARNGIAALFTFTMGLSTAYAAPAPTIKHVFVITMENHDESQIIGNPKNAPYINGKLIPIAARAANFMDESPLGVPSEPHYIWMEAGTNAFSDHTFTNDHDPSEVNSTDSADHLVAQMDKVATATWMSYQEGLSSETGACPIESKKLYAAKHDPFVFFQDVSGDPPLRTNVYCAQHHKPFSSFASDLAAGAMASYVFITPNLCHDMHGALRCPFGNIKAGDQWLAENLPPIIDWVQQNAGVIFLVWDEGEDTSLMPFLAIGPGVKADYAGHILYDHGSIVKSLEEIFSLPALPKVSGNNDLADLFQPGFFP